MGALPADGGDAEGEMTRLVVSPRMKNQSAVRAIAPSELPCAVGATANIK